jgi:hypothetical protein
MGQPYWCISGHAGDRITTARAATGTYVRVDIYYSMSPDDKFLVWLSGEVKTPPFSAEARLEAGFLLRRLQQGEKLSLPHSRPMPSVGAGCHELRIVDQDVTWRIIHFVDTDGGDPPHIQEEDAGYTEHNHGGLSASTTSLSKHAERVR